LKGGPVHLSILRKEEDNEKCHPLSYFLKKKEKKKARKKEKVEEEEKEKGKIYNH